MKFSPFIFFSLGLICLLSCQPQKSAEQIKEEILATEKLRKEAINNNDIEIIDQTMHEDYRFLTPAGKVVDKEGEMEGFQKGVTKFDSFTTDEVEIRVFGQTAIVTGKANIKGISEGRDITGSYRYTRVYYSEKESWQIVSSQFNPIKN